MVRVGDLGCAGIDVEKWRAENRVPLFPNKMNRWLLVRTLRDRPDPDDVKHTLLAVFNKWFEGSPIDPVLSSSGGAPGPVDNVVIVKSSNSPFSLSDVAKRRESLSTLPTANGSHGLLYLEVHFAYRALTSSMPWPVRTAPGLIGVGLASSAECPINADWMLLEAGKPLVQAPPEVPMTSVLAGKTGEVLKVAAETAAGAAESLLAPLFWPLVIGGAAFGAYVYLTQRR
jgi:hypothetical protein